MSRGRLIVATLCVGVVVATALATRSCGAPDPAPAREPLEPAPPADVAPLGPTTHRSGVPAGWRHDQAGARAAAVAAVGLTGTIALAGFITREDMITALATAEFAGPLAEASSTQIVALLGDLDEAGITPDQVLFREIPVTARVADADADTAEVEVWSMLVVGVPGKGAPRQVWRTVTVGLAWEDDDWRVDAWTARAGPTPGLAVSSEVASLDEVAEVIAWPAAGGG